MALVDDLIAAKALIDTPAKWRQDGKFGYGTGCYCVMGAVNTLHPNIDEHFREVKHAITDKLPYGTSIVAFNDDPATTHADVMALFDRAIEAAK